MAAPADKSELETFEDSILGKAANTKKTYLQAYHKLRDALEKDIHTASQKNIIEHVEELAPEMINSQAQLINVAILIRRLYQFDVKELIAKRDDNKVTIQECVKQNNSLMELPPLQEFDDHIESLYAASKWREFIINYLLRNCYVRNNDLLFEIVRRKKDTKDRQVFSVKMSVGPSAGQRAIVTEMTSAQLAQAVAAVKANPDVYKGQDPRILGSMGLSSSLANGWDGKSPIAEPVFQTIMESWGRTNQTPSTQQITQAEQQVQQVESKTSTADQESYVKTQQKQIDTESDAPTKAYLQYQLDLWKYNKGFSQIKPAKVDAPLTAASRTALASYQQQLAQEQQSNQQAQLTEQSAQAKLTAAKADYSDKAQAFNQSLRTEVSNEYQQMRTYNIAYAMASGTPIDAATGYTAFNPNSLYRQNAIVNVGSPVTPIIAPMAANQPRLLATPA